jgi:3-hydroxyisobutyrate dehydrogenase-like beta-hydroxyacid dehydrogenase
LGEKAGLDREQLLDVLSKTAVIAPAHAGTLAGTAIHDYSPRFPLRLMNKDFQLILEAAAEERISMPATEAAFYVNSDELARNDNDEKRTSRPSCGAWKKLQVSRLFPRLRRRVDLEVG